MKKTLTVRLSLVFMIGLLSLSGVFQSCTKNNEVQPIKPIGNTVTVKVRNYQGNADVKHLRIVSIPASAGVNLDIKITGNYEYTFPVNNPNISVSATLISGTPFVCALEIDGNYKMQAYHSGGCAVNEFNISREMSF